MTVKPRRQTCLAGNPKAPVPALASSSAPCGAGVPHCASDRRGPDVLRSLAIAALAGRRRLLSWDPFPLHRLHCVRPLRKAFPPPSGVRNHLTRPVPPARFRTASTAFSASSSRACCIPLAIMGFAAFLPESPPDVVKTEFPRSLRPAPESASSRRDSHPSEACTLLAARVAGRVATSLALILFDAPAWLSSQPREKVGGARSARRAGAPCGTMARATGNHASGWLPPGDKLASADAAPPPCPSSDSGPCSTSRFVPHHQVSPVDWPFLSWASVPSKVIRPPLSASSPACGCMPSRRCVAGLGIPVAARTLAHRRRTGDGATSEDRGTPDCLLGGAPRAAPECRP